ncbi:TIGR01458 family HAD-type hydrolase [Vibrio sp. EA2]|uniref:TIGR01458 family HAD-type hydrolase n=1 Tax=Vibrio sp. EA2 TaxID=3079860 RepID=UPI002948F5B8|nr:TIGR01458 family HAD-type hydrolase [Vibrio sp. EA2]MDV6249728.1 TIGR01458 family HAD-type hydrolase [Vibrio sp. EA2]
MKERQNKISGLLLDLEGVLFVEKRVIEGAIEAVEYLQKQQIPFRFMTNTTTKSRNSIAEKMLQMGFNVQSEDILTAPYAAKHYLEQKENVSCYLLVADEVKNEFAGFQQTDQHPDVIVVGDIGPTWDYALINKVFQMVMSGSELIALHKGKYWQTTLGLQVDIGAFVAGIEYVTNKQAVVIGKPSPAFFDAGVDALGCEKKHIVMIGDDIDSDVGGAQQAGIMGALVKTGKYRKETCLSSTVNPDFILDSIADFKQLFV